MVEVVYPQVPIMRDTTSCSDSLEKTRVPQLSKSPRFFQDEEVPQIRTRDITVEEINANFRSAEDFRFDVLEEEELDSSEKQNQKASREKQAQELFLMRQNFLGQKPTSPPKPQKNPKKLPEPNPIQQFFPKAEPRPKKDIQPQVQTALSTSVPEQIAKQ